MAVVREKKSGGCCLFKLFLILVVLAALLIACVIGAAWWGKNKLVAYGSPAPLGLSYPTATPEELLALKARPATPATPGGPALYTDREINQLIGNDPSFVAAKDRFFVKINNGQGTILVSYPIVLDMNVLSGAKAPAGTPFLNAVVKLEPDPASTSTLRLKVASVDLQNTAITAAEEKNFADFLGGVVQGLNEELATKAGGGYFTLEGNTLALYPGLATVTPVPETSVVAPVDPGATTLPESSDTPAPAPGN
jgi:hypothetical protein